MGLDIRLLGPLEVVRDGEVVDLGGRKQRAVVAVLAAHAGSVVPVDRLIDAVWAGEPPAGAANGLQVYVSHLRRVLEPDRAPRQPATVLVTQAPGYRLGVAPEQVDVHRFTALVAEGSAAALDEALALWRGSPLAEFAYDEWAVPEIRRLEEVQAAAVEDRLALAEPAEAIPRLEQMVAATPGRERLWALLMLALWRTGRQAEALEAFQRARRALADALGIEPGPALRELEGRILAHDASLGWEPVHPAVEAATGAADPAEPFVGRAGERSRLSAALDRAVAGRGGVVLVGGEPGMGKTRLAEELAREAGARGVAVGWGRSPESEAAAPYWPWRQALGDGAEVFDVDRPGDPGGARARLFDDVAAALAGGPRLVVLDDVHWADGSSLALLEALAGRVAGLPVLVVATFREADAGRGTALGRALGVLARERGVERLVLAGLDVDGVAALVEALAGGSLGAEAGAALAARTGGNPFFVTELARAVGAAGDMAAAPVPASVREVVRRRLDQLPDSTRAVLDVAAVAGHTFAVDVVSAAAGLGVDDGLDALDAALASGVVVPADEGTATLRFAHALIAEAIAGDQTTIQRARVHARVAAALTGRGVDPVERAHHLFRGAVAGTAAEAVTASVAAAELASARLGHTEAVALWRQALAALDIAAPTDRRRRTELLVGLGRACGRAGDDPGEADALHRAMDLAEEGGDDDLLIDAATSFGEGSAWRWRPYGTIDAGTIAALERSLARLDPAPTPVRARVLGHLAVELGEDDPARRRALGAEAVAVARATGDPAVLARALRHSFLCRWWPEDAPDRVALGQELVLVAEQSGDAEAATVARFFAMFSLREMGRVAEADALLDRCRVDVERLALPSLGYQLRWYRAGRALLAGDLDEAEELALQARDAHRRTGHAGAEPPYALHQLSAARLGRPLPPGLEPALAPPLAPAVLALLQGDPDRARAIVGWDRGPTLAPHPGALYRVYGLCWEAWLCHELDVVAVARPLYDALAPFSGRMAVGGSATNDEGAVDHFLGLLAHTLGDVELARRHLEADVAQHRAIPAPLHVARAEAALARLP